MKEYLICPSYIRSKNDGQEHFITATQLMMLYGVNPRNCDVLEYNAPDVLNRPYKKILYPNYNGDYNLLK